MESVPYESFEQHFMVGHPRGSTVFGLGRTPLPLLPHLRPIRGIQTV